MATLSDTAYISRKVIMYGAATLVALMVGRVLLSGIVTLWTRLNPPPPPPPTYGFGTLPEIEFPDSTAELTYTLQTANGRLPSFSDRANVYPVVTSRPNLLALDEAREKAAQLGFDGPAIKRSDLLYLWERSTPLPARLNMYIYSGNFVLSVDWFADANYLFSQSLPTEERAEQAVERLLSRAQSMPNDIDTASVRTSYLRASGQSLVPAISLSEADFIEVNMFRQAIGEEELMPLPPNPDQGLIRAIVGGTDVATGLVNLEYNYFPVNYEQYETYPLRPASVAWEELSAGGGYVARVDQGVEEVIVRRVELGYFDAYSPQDYLQPVYVFFGDDEFVGYVPALDPVSYQDF